MQFGNREWQSNIGNKEIKVAANMISDWGLLTLSSSDVQEQHSQQKKIDFSFLKLLGAANSCCILEEARFES